MVDIFSENSRNGWLFVGFNTNKEDRGTEREIGRETHTGRERQGERERQTDRQRH